VHVQWLGFAAWITAQHSHGPGTAHR